MYFRTGARRPLPDDVFHLQRLPANGVGRSTYSMRDLRTTAPLREVGAWQSQTAALSGPRRLLVIFRINRPL